MNKRKNNSMGYGEIKIYIIDHCFEMPFDRSNSSKIYLLVIAIKTDKKPGKSSRYIYFGHLVVMFLKFW